MAQITDLASLKQAVLDWTQAVEIEQMLDQLVQLAEVDLNQRLRTREMVERATATSNEQYVALPSNWLEAISLRLEGGKSPLRFVTQDEALHVIAEQVYSRTTFYSIMDSAIELVPPPGGNVTIEMVFYKKIPALTNASPTNWLLTKAPDTYLFGTLVQAIPLLQNDARIATFGPAYLQRIEALNAEADKSMHSGSPLIARTRRAY